ncbi:MAG: hypothetical protein FD127_2248 [Acidimicrobiaceae bacterium]|nr:MAG: hypothetical protein FD127_2248 [Acidimicrobiaceae bacterium]
MTALADRRRRRTLTMLLFTVLVMGAIPVLGYVGVRAVLDSTGGKDAQAGVLPVQEFPDTPAALFVTSVPVNSDVGFTDSSRQSLQGVYAAGGLEATALQVESLLLVTINHSAEADLQQAAGFLLAYEPFTVDLATEVSNGSTGEADSIAAGTVVLDAANAAKVLTYGAGIGEETIRKANLEALWVGVAAAVGTGQPVASAVPGTAQPPVSFDDFVNRLFSSSVQSRGLSTVALTAAQNPDELDIVQLDRSEAVFVFASIAPGSMSAPGLGPIIRVEAPSGYDLQVKLTLDKLLFLAANVVSVDTSSAPQPDTIFFVPDEANRIRAQTTDVIFGEIVFGEPTVRVSGVDVTIVLGIDYLESVET